MKRAKWILAAGVASVTLLASEAFADCASNPCTDGVEFVDNAQTQNGAVTSSFSQTSDHADEAAGSAASAGANATVIAKNAALTLKNTQSMNANAKATSDVRVKRTTGSLTSAAFAGGTGLVSQNTGAKATIDSSQTTAAGVAIDSKGYAAGRIMHEATAALSATSVANAADLSTANGDLTAKVAQTSGATVSARSEADLQACCGSASSGAIASANNLLVSGSTTTMQVNASQKSTGSVKAVSDLYVGDQAAVLVGSAAASGNAATMQNAWGYVDARIKQDNAASVDAHSWVTGSKYDSAAAGGFAVGNTAQISNVGSDMRINVDQVNSGAVRSWSGLAGSGGVGVATATAIGNEHSAALCTQCGDATMSAISRQTNNGNVEAIATINAPTIGRSVGSAAAFGNAATYYVGSKN